jgi:hypothetical protein
VHSPTKTDPVTEHFGEVISTHSRGQAIEDGVLVDAGDMARQAGFRFHVAITPAVWSDCVVWTDADSSGQVHQDQSGTFGTCCSWPTMQYVPAAMAAAG